MSKRRLFVALAVILATLAVSTAAGAVIGGEKDGGRHPNVAAIDVYFDDGLAASCSGTLIAPTVVLTAAHCLSIAGISVDHVAVSFDEEPAVNASGFLAGTTIPGASWEFHPDYLQPSGTNLNADMGVIVLDRPATDLWPGVVPAQLPVSGALNRLAALSGPKPLLSVVGYGYHEAATKGKPTYDWSPVERRTGTVKVAEVSGLLTLTNNYAPNSPTKATICSGDSGGALMTGNTLVGVISFHRAERLKAWRGGQSQAEANSASSWCEGLGGYPRLDTTSARTFLDDFVSLP